MYREIYLNQKSNSNDCKEKLKKKNWNFYHHGQDCPRPKYLQGDTNVLSKMAAGTINMEQDGGSRVKRNRQPYV